MRRDDRRAGFTLIEVLAALAITGALVSVALPYATRLVTRWWLGERTVEVADGWMQAITRLDDDLSQALPLSLPGEGKAITAFRAGTNFVQFVRPALGQASGTDLDTVRYEIRPSTVGAMLVRRTRRFDPVAFVAEPNQGGLPTTLIEGSFRFRFFAIGEDHVPRETWPGGADLPVAMGLSAVATSNNQVPPGPILLPIAARAMKGPPAIPDGG